VELLAVIAIIGVLVGLLLPAVQTAREASRRSTCQNNVKNLSLGVLGFESTTGYLPHGGIEWAAGYQRQNIWPDAASRGNAGWSWLYFILPYSEALELFNIGAVQPGEQVEPAGSPERGRRLNDRGASWMRCPSDLEPYYNRRWPNIDSRKRSLSNYAVCAGPRMPTGNEGQDTCGTTLPRSLFTPNITGFSAGSIHPSNTNPANTLGMFTYVGQTGGISPTIVADNESRMRVRLKDVTDGVSKTLMLGECYVLDRNKQDDSNAFVPWSMHPVSTMLPINIPDEAYGEGCSPGNWATGVGFKSRHSSGANFAFGDGAVRFLNQNLNMTVFQRLGHRRDGQPIDTTGF